jgi:hypothetical protein
MLAKLPKEKPSSGANPQSTVLKEDASKKENKPKLVNEKSKGTLGASKTTLSPDAQAGLSPILSFAQGTSVGNFILPKLEPLKYTAVDNPYTMVGKGLKDHFFIKELQKGKFVNKKIVKVAETVISGLSNFLTGIDKKRNASAAKRIIKRPISAAEIMNFMTMTYLEE